MATPWGDVIVPTREALRPNECMIRTGLLVGLAGGFAAVGYLQVGAGIGVFAAVQVLTLIAQGVDRNRASKV